MMIAVDVAADRLLGVEIVGHSETPGVGAKVETAAFRDQWKGLPAGEPVKFRSEGGAIDAISGATSSSRAMIDGTNQVIGLLRDHRDDIEKRIGASTAKGAE